MFDNLAEMFANRNAMMGVRVKKVAYKQNMYNFRVEYGADFQEMVDTVNASENKEETAMSLGKTFSEKTFELFEKKGKVKSTTKAELNMFMIFFVFPAILLTQSEAAVLTCDKLRDEWNAKFGEKINYTDYDTLYDGFRDKIFGIF